MLVDFHTHLFPDKIATNTIRLLSDNGKIPYYFDGTESGLLAHAQKSGVTVCIGLPVLTKPSQFDSVALFARALNERNEQNENSRIISFGGIHPRCEDIEKKMEYLKRLGILGVKIHPDYQETDFDDEGYIRIIKSAKELDMIVVTHAGIDCVYNKIIRCTPEKIVRVMDIVEHKKLVLAHMGSCDMFDQVYDMIAGREVYLDTAFVLPYIGKETFVKILEKHGADKILFASDCPWRDIYEQKLLIDGFGLKSEDKDKILYKNALKLLGLEKL